MPSKQKNKIAFFYYAPTLVWMGVIFYFSGIPGLTKTANPDIWFYVIRKGAHITEYFILTCLFFNLLCFYKLKKKNILQLAFLFSLAYAFSDEIHQLFVPGREGKLLDIGFDFIGIALAVFLFAIFRKQRNKSKKSIKSRTKS